MRRGRTDAGSGAPRERGEWQAEQPAAEARRKKAKEAGTEAAHEAVMRAEREEPPLGSEADRPPPGFERD